jgi:hypothetical protein
MKYPATKLFPVLLQRSFKRQKIFSISNVEKFSTIPGNEIFAKHLLAQGIKVAF